MPAAVTSLPADPAAIAMLPGCDFADAFSISVTGRPDARQAARLVFSDALPDWAIVLMRLRNAAAGRIGLKTGGERKGFPVLRESAEEVVMGLDDRHLDFRAVVRVDAAAEGSRITLTTLVRRHNSLGRIYLAVIMPFHKLIVRSLLAQLAAKVAA